MLKAIEGEMLRAKGERNTGEWRKGGDGGYGGSKHEGVEKSGFVDFHFRFP
jgi:hypothetical protein